VSVPSWLAPHAEIPAPSPNDRASASAFVREQWAVLAALDVPEGVRIELVAIAAWETGWGKSAARQVHNVVGAKVKRDIAAWHLRRLGYALRWFRYAGHVNSGDAKVVTYCAFADAETCWRMSLERVFGRAPWAEDYRPAASKLWAGDPDWVRSLIVEGGYRGTRSAANPGPSVAAHRSVVARVRKLLAA
jgi:hypothetical protein